LKLSKQCKLRAFKDRICKRATENVADVVQRGEKERKKGSSKSWWT